MTIIKRRRQRLGLSQSALAKKANLYTSNLSKFETGRDKAGEVVQGRIAAALGTERKALFCPNGWALESSDVQESAGVAS